ncbi:MAG: ethanolamine utilization protein EutN [Caldithrix sp.]|nr:ethanolamine utilization protein EutN [Caldithrix sp.]
MNLAKIIGTVWATQKDQHLEGIRMQVIQPITWDGKNSGSPLVAVDTVGAGVGEIIYYVTAYEAVLPLKEKLTLTDASIVGIVDHIEVYNT